MPRKKQDRRPRGYKTLVELEKDIADEKRLLFRDEEKRITITKAYDYNFNIQEKITDKKSEVCQYHQLIGEALDKLNRKTKEIIAERTAEIANIEIQIALRKQSMREGMKEKENPG